MYSSQRVIRLKCHHNIKAAQSEGTKNNQYIDFNSVDCEMASVKSCEINQGNAELRLAKLLQN